ncbi:PKD domain-containing protein [Candidatus Poriferisocius sp.]|uniref:PKD domain-containing protein n=1 Tax=Candidatus Poriferisocius sp. TaxID=3101276 RepID=UPI003B58CEA0
MPAAAATSTATAIRTLLATLLAAALIATLLVTTAPVARAQVNVAPIADAGPDQTYPVGAAVRTLRGSRSFDIDNDISDLSYRWDVLTPAYDWIFITNIGAPLGSEATFIAPSQREVNLYGSSITFRLTVTDPDGDSGTDTVTVSFEGPPSVSIGVAANLPTDDPVDLDRDGFIEDEERYIIDAVLARPNQDGNSDIEWDVREKSRLTLTAAASTPSGNQQLQYSWRKLSAVPNHPDYNIPSAQVKRPSFSLLLPDLEEDRSTILHYTVTVTAPTGVQATATVRINLADEPTDPEVELTLLDNKQPAQDANAANPDAPTLNYLVTPGTTVHFIANGTDADGNQANSLVHTWTGPGVTPHPTNPTQGAKSRASITVPADAEQGQTFIATVSVADTTNRTAQDQIVLTVALNVAPTAIAPANIATEDGPRGGTNKRGTVFVTGRGSDPDGTVLSYRWVEVDDDGIPLEKPTVELRNPTTATVSFDVPQLSTSGRRDYHLAFTVIDQWGVGDTDTVTVTVLGRNERPEADAGPDQTVEPGVRVQLNASDSNDPDPGTTLDWEWEYTGFATTPSQSERPLSSYEKNVALRAFLPDGDDFSNLSPLVGKDTPVPYFIAPQLGGLSSVRLTFTVTVTDRAGGSDFDSVTIDVTGRFFSGTITGPDFCTNLSLGGARTYAFDSDGNGVADVCSLPYTRREAVARQNALTTLASLDQARFRTEVLAACDELSGDFGDSTADLDNDACETNQVSEPPPPVDPAVAATFFSGTITGPDFCTNLSLGGATTYAFDSTGDGVANVCSLPYTRREAVARQNALEAFAAPEAVFNSALALACRNLGSTTFPGDTVASMALDACA